MQPKIPAPPTISDAEYRQALADPSLDEVPIGGTVMLREMVEKAWNQPVDDHPIEYVAIRAVLRPGNYGGGGHSTDWRADWNTLYPGRLPTVAEWIAWTCHHKISKGGGTLSVWAGDPGMRDLAFRVRILQDPAIFPVKPQIAEHSARRWWLTRHARMVEVGLDPGYTVEEVSQAFPEPEESTRYPVFDLRAAAQSMTEAQFSLTLAERNNKRLTLDEARQLGRGTYRMRGMFGPLDTFWQPGS